MTPEEYVEAVNCFGRLLDLMSERELQLFSNRAAWKNDPQMHRLYEVLEDEIAERKIEA